MSKVDTSAAEEAKNNKQEVAKKQTGDWGEDEDFDSDEGDEGFGLESEAMPQSASRPKASESEYQVSAEMF